MNTLSRHRTIKRRHQTRPLVHRAAVWSLIGLCASVALLATCALGMFRVREVKVVGSNLPRDRIVLTAGVLGQNIFTVQSEDVIRRLDSVPIIVVRRVSTALPGTVIIYADSRIPVVAWQNSQNLYELDAQGRMIQSVTSTTLPIITGTGNAENLDPGVVQAVQYAVRQIPTAPDGQITSLRYDRERGITIVGRSGWTANAGTGSAQTLIDRIATLVSVLVYAQTHHHHLREVDLRYSDVLAARWTGT